MAFQLKDQVVVLTGAASGIGAALAQVLASHGAALALVDKDESGLEQTAAALTSQGHTVSTYAMDVTNLSAVAALPQAVSTYLGSASVLINNAGVALGGRFDQVTGEQFDRVMQINFTATVNLTRAFLPQLRASSPSQIVNLSSIFGIVGVPHQVAYCASKFAVRGFSEALRLELAGSDVGITVVHPGGVRTNIARSSDAGPGVSPQERASMLATSEKLLRLSPEKVAARIVTGIVRRKKRLVIGADAHLLTALGRLFPASYGRFFPKS